MDDGSVIPLERVSGAASCRLKVTWEVSSYFALCFEIQARGYILKPKGLMRWASLMKLSVFFKLVNVASLSPLCSLRASDISSSNISMYSGLAHKSRSTFVMTSALVCIAAMLRKSIRFTSWSVSASRPCADSTSHCTMSGCSALLVERRAAIRGTRRLRATPKRLRICLQEARNGATIGWRMR